MHGANAQTADGFKAQWGLGRREFVAMMAMIFGLQALGIDVMLPALDEIAGHFARDNANDQQLVVLVFVMGFGFPQLIWGPIADRYGRKVLLQAGLVGYTVFAVLCMFSPSFEALLAFRLCQGIACSATRVSAGAIIRDVSAGRAMASILSLVYTIFMIVPILAPSLGAAVLLFADWPWTFGILGVFAALVFVWTALRLPATLEQPRPISLSNITSAFGTVFRNRTSFGYMCASGIVFGSLFAFIAASEQIFGDVFEREGAFPLYFAGIAGGLAVMNFFNSRFVERFGMRRISHLALFVFVTSSLINVVWMQFVGEDFWVFYVLFAVAFACFGMMGANFASLAMEPMGEIAGTANAVYGFFTSTGAALIGALIARQFDGMVAPILWGYVGLGLTSLVIILVTEGGRLFDVGEEHKNSVFD